MNLIGLDVGFSRTKATSGLAILEGDTIRLFRTTASAQSRLEHLASDFAADVVAIDAPLLADHNTKVRVCEQTFARGVFQRRCKPGFSHVPGTGLQLREAGEAAATQLCQIASTNEFLRRVPKVSGQYNIVEAFPNAFLGVCMPDKDYMEMPSLRRGRKFDWLYERWRDSGTFAQFRSHVSDVLPTSFVEECDETKDHEKRAALICLATAACVAGGKFTAVGDSAGGYFFLPPQELWSDWAKRELNRLCTTATVEVHAIRERTVERPWVSSV